MSTNLAIVDGGVPPVTTEQVALIKTTIAKDATDTELQLFFFYDCRRQGVHPLDKLIHFTKRGGKYTPITSIDFMRQRAAQTGECGGIDDAIFVGEPKTPDVRGDGHRLSARPGPAVRLYRDGQVERIQAGRRTTSCGRRCRSSCSASVRKP